MIPFLDLKASFTELKVEIEDAILKIARSGWYILGEEVQRFERDYARYCNVNYCVGVGNGLDALHLALRAMDVGPGDEVIVPSNTYIATWLAVSQCGATPVPVEPDERTYTIDPRQIARAITKSTKVILPTHLYGHPADMDSILAIARDNGLRVLEDAAQSHGAKYKNVAIGGHGDVVAWSFYPGKNLGGMGDAGAITTNDYEIAERVRVLRNYGSRVKYINEVQGFNSRLDPIQAAVLSVKLRYLDEWNERRAAIAGNYKNSLESHSIDLPFVSDWSTHAWHLFVILNSDRDKLREYLLSQNIETLIHYPVPPHLQAAYSVLGYKRGDFPIAEKIANQGLSLPISPHMTTDQLEEVISVCKSFVSFQACK